MPKYTSFSVSNSIKGKSNSSVFSTNTTLVIGILNITNDSFYDGGKFVNNTQIITQCKKMLDEGATVIEIGAQSSKPGAIQISSKDELKKLLPTIKLLKNTFKEIILSIDTFWSNTAKACILEGADMINDISAGNIDKDIFKVVAKYNVPYIIMHMKGTPKNMQDKPEYNNVVDEIIEYFIEKITTLNNIGIKKIIIDPGFGFGKTINHNFKILNNLDKANFSNFQPYSDESITNLARLGSKSDIFIIFPKYVSFYSLFAEYQDIEKKYFSGIRTLVKNTDAQVWLFYGANDLTNNIDNFIDNGWHFKPKLSNIIFDEVFNFDSKSLQDMQGILVTKENLDQHLSKISNEISAFSTGYK